MKRFLLSSLILAASLVSGCQVKLAQAASLRGLFRSSVAMNCVAQGADLGTTLLALHAGAREGNGMFVNHGQFSVSTLALVKTIQCAVPPLARVILGKTPTGYAVGTASATAMAAPSAYGALHNFGVWNAQKKIDAAAALQIK